MNNISGLIEALKQVFKKDYLSIDNMESGIGYLSFVDDLNPIYTSIKNHIISSRLTLDEKTYKKYTKGVAEIIIKIEIEKIILSEIALQLLLKTEYNYNITLEELEKNSFLKIKYDTWLYNYTDLKLPYNQLEYELIVKINRVLINYSKKRIINELEKELYKTIEKENNNDFFINDDIRTKFHNYRNSTDLNIFSTVSYLFQKLNHKKKLLKCTHYEFATWLFENDYCKKSSYEIFKSKRSYTTLPNCTTSDREILFEVFFNF
jgi:hypothetical protein